MAQAETPSISGYAHTHALYDGGGMEAMGQAAGTGWVGGNNVALNQQQGLLASQALPVAKLNQPFRAVRAKPPQEEKMPTDIRRYVQIFIADPDPKVPIGQSLIHTTDAMMTDLSDMELYFGLDVKRLLDHHNESVRAKTVDKDIKDRTAYLEPARIRDLKMVVTNLAVF